jgi:predicted SprT family Zn-dependent metalloprotease
MQNPPPGLSPEWLREHPEVEDLLELWPPERIQEELDQVLQLWGVLDLTTAIRWRWYPRLRTTLGRAVFLDMLVELNPLLLARHPDQVRELLIHEAAHLVVQRLHGRQPPHGPYWKAYMRKAGASTHATHQLDVAGLKRKPSRRKRRRRRVSILKLFRKKP